MAGTGWLRGTLAAGFTSAVVLIGSGMGSAALAAPAQGSVTPAPGSVQWSSAQAGAGSAIAADPKGGKVFALGSSFLIAYSAATGAPLWTNSQGAGQFLAVSPDGSVVYVSKSGTGADYFTAAFDAATGSRLWTATYNGPANGTDRPTALAVSPSGSTVFVTGFSQGKVSGQDYATVAYNASTGAQLWASRYNGQGRSHDMPAAIAVSPGSNAVFVTGVSFGASIGSRFATVGYSATTGKPLWTRTYDQPNKRNAASSVAVSPDGHRVIVTGESDKRAVGEGFATISYTEATGHQQWIAQYHVAGDSNDTPDKVLVTNHIGGRVIVVGDGVARHGGVRDYIAVAYTVSGQRRWAGHYSRPSFVKDYFGGAVLSPDGRVLYMTGSAFIVPGGEEPTHSLTVSVNLRQGQELWSQVVTTDETDQGGGPIAVSPGGSFVYLGVEDFTDTFHDFTTFSLHA